MTAEELKRIQPTLETVTDSEQVALDEEELKNLSEINDELIDIERKSVSEGEVLEKLLENKDFLAFIDMYTIDEAKRLSDSITSTTSLTSSTLVTLQEMQISIRHFKQFILSKQNESHGATLRLDARLEDKVKIDNGNVFKEVGGV